MSENKNGKSLLLNELEILNSLNEVNGFSKFRDEAYQLWKNTPAPTSRDEYWKYTRVAPLLNKSYSADNQYDNKKSALVINENAFNLVFVNGELDEARSTTCFEEDFIFCDLKTAKEKCPELLKESMNNATDVDDYFSLLNNAFHQNGPFVYLGKNKVVEEPLNVAFLSNESDRLINVKSLVVAESSSKALILESWCEEGGSDNLINSKGTYSVAENASIELIKFQSIGSKNSLINQDFIDQARDSKYIAHTISINGKMIRNNVNSILNGEGAYSELNGLYTLKGNEHVDNHTQVTHAVPNCESHELYKGILNEKSKGVFNGKVIVSKDAQKTNAFQFNGNILLTDDAEVYSKPELEIYADDVKCSHGSTTGQLDQEALFYLQARGISKDGARNLLLHAFASEVIEKIPVQSFKDKLENHLLERYHTKGNV